MSLKITPNIQIAVIACLAVVAIADQSPYPPPPAPYHPPPPAYHSEPHYPDSTLTTFSILQVPPKYAYNYGISDDYGVNLGHSESRDEHDKERVRPEYIKSELVFSAIILSAAMSLKITVIACLAIVAIADQSPYPPPPAPYHPPPPAYHSEPHYPDVPPKYAYNYGISDDYGANFGHSESRDGNSLVQ
ncbi:uncharacterized protein LOC134778727 [Penaeus indicus]|uniref:uncharacterized protein LOC134778727 n=1 Tax=Penaeus indicus TaxID=29960 RepID=UPI00300C3C8F